MKTFKIPCSWEVYGVLNIEAETLNEALELAERDDMPLPTDSNYVDGSFIIETDIAEILNK